MKTIKLAALISLTAALAACSGSRPENEPGYKELERARQAVARAEQNPCVGGDAPLDLKKAQENLGRAEYTWYDEEGDLDEEEAEYVIHYSYLAERYAEVAEARCRSAEAERTWQRVLSENDQVAREARALALAHERAARANRMRLEKLEREIDALRGMKQNGVSTRQEDRGLVITMSDVLFAFDSDRVSAQYGPMLDKLVTYLSEDPKHAVLVEGHTDSIGTVEYNADLSERRAEAVRRALISRGANARSVKVRGYGESRPVASNNSANGRRQNRRVELIVN
ncbi:MAG: OmpA family protein [Nevskiales bacterium]